ncbi:hypothetical protein GCM10010492_58140 [Saccharothrix mutabilis subsp. mutabilis]|uniref:Pyridoxamine 5'-phosphate oxidase N-terminal domain-containing protein n=1 Tax=Saccharothrix mutabilis subsp. mutabilis TaxID=66855 RepID=A0ABN0UH33_9PSEU
MITRDVDASAVADLARTPPRAALAAVVDDRIHLVPVEAALEQPGDPATSARVVRVPGDAPDLAGRDVVVVADDGPQWFRLRSLAVRGTAVPVGDGTYRLTPRRVVAWDYGSLRDVPGAARPQPPAPFGGDDDSALPFRTPDLDTALSTSRVMVIATRSRKGTPFAVPLWFVPHHGRFYAATAASSWTVRNVLACPEVAVLFGGEGGHDGDRLLVRGRARAVPGMTPAPVLARIVWRYFLSPRFATAELAHARLWNLRRRYYTQSRPAYVVITPLSAVHCGVPAIESSSGEVSW